MESFLRTVRALSDWARQGLPPDIPVSSSFVILLAGIVHLSQSGMDVTPQRLIATTNQSSSSVYRCLERLLEAKMLERTNNGGYQLTAKVPHALAKTTPTTMAFDARTLKEELVREVVKAVKDTMGSVPSPLIYPPIVSTPVEALPVPSQEETAPINPFKDKYKDVLL